MYPTARQPAQPPASSAKLGSIALPSKRCRREAACTSALRELPRGPRPEDLALLRAAKRLNENRIGAQFDIGEGFGGHSLASADASDVTVSASPGTSVNKNDLFNQVHLPDFADSRSSVERHLDGPVVQSGGVGDSIARRTSAGSGWAWA